jgi:hypothetical protein
MSFDKHNKYNVMIIKKGNNHLKYCSHLKSTFNILTIKNKTEAL